MNPSLERAELLFQQDRHDLAEQELRQVISADPNQFYPRALLAMCLSEQKRFDEATEEARQAILLAPDVGFSHFALARVLTDRNRHQESLKAIQEAARLDPSDADYAAFEAQCHHNLKDWKQSLAAAERGLAMDAEHVDCANMRAIALVKLGRNAEAGQSIDSTLAKQPESAVTHANKGWTLLHQGDAKTALEHFREALRLDPTNEWAQAGIVEALKARNFIYAIMLKYFLFMSRLSTGMQWGIILGAYFLGRWMSGMAGTYPDMAQWILPFRILLFSFVIMTWLAYPLFNLLLRLNRFGRMALSREQVIESNWIGGFLALALVSLGGCIVKGMDSPWLVMLAVFGLFLLPLCGLFRCTGSNRKFMLAAVCVLFLLGLGAVVQTWQSPFDDESSAPTNSAFFGWFLLGVFAATILANVLAGREEQS